MSITRLNRTHIFNSLEIIQTSLLPQFSQVCPDGNATVRPPPSPPPLLAAWPPSRLRVRAAWHRCGRGPNDSKFSVLFSNAPSTLQNIPPYFIRGRGESEPSRDRREEQSSSGEHLLSDILERCDLIRNKQEKKRRRRRGG